MPSLYNDDFAFIHVPKTGGTWVVNALKAARIEFTEVTHRDGHVWWNELPDVFRFGFVREPSSWLRSYWNHKMRHAEFPEPLSNLDIVFKASQTFEDFRRVAVHERLVEEVYEQFLGPPGAVDFVGRYENLRYDLATALCQAGVCWEWEVEDYRRLLGEPAINFAPTRKRELLIPLPAQAFAES